MNIRTIEKEDLDIVSRLFNDYRFFYRKEPDIAGSKQFLSERLENNDSKIYVCEYENDNIVGFVQLYPLFSSTRMKKLWLLNDLFVHPDYRGKGVSIQLIEKAKELVRETKACGMFLETEKSNAIGNNLYPKTGFALNEGSNYYEWNVE